jgi:hypothetical protein
MVAAGLVPTTLLVIDIINVNRCVISRMTMKQFAMLNSRFLSSATISLQNFMNETCTFKGRIRIERAD